MNEINGWMKWMHGWCNEWMKSWMNELLFEKSMNRLQGGGEIEGKKKIEVRKGVRLSKAT